MSSTWSKPPSVYDVAKPNAHNTNKTTTKVYNMIASVGPRRSTPRASVGAAGRVALGARDRQSNVARSTGFARVCDAFAEANRLASLRRPGNGVTRASTLHLLAALGSLSRALTLEVGCEREPFDRDDGLVHALACGWIGRVHADAWRTEASNDDRSLDPREHLIAGAARVVAQVGV